MWHALARALEHPATRGMDPDHPLTTTRRRQLIAEKRFLRRINEEWYGRLAALVPEGPGAADFFLVVPNGLELEGSYGADSGGGLRVPSSTGCFPQAAIDECA